MDGLILSGRTFVTALAQSFRPATRVSGLNDRLAQHITRTAAKLSNYWAAQC